MAHFLGSRAMSAMLAGGLFCWLSPVAQGQEYCVVCKDPGAIYRCVLQNAGPSRNQPLKIACITAIASAGKHASCAVRGGTVFDCNGPVTRVDAMTGEVAGAHPSNPPTAAAVVPQPASSTPQTPTKTTPPDDKAPATVEEVIKRATTSTSDTMSKAGRTISEGAKKSWNCVTTLFKSC